MEPLTLRRHALLNLIRDLRFEVGAQLLGASIHFSINSAGEHGIRARSALSYSVLRACMGLILEARRAGSHAAPTVTQATAAIAMAIAVGSSGLN